MRTVVTCKHDDLRNIKFELSKDFSQV